MEGRIKTRLQRLVKDARRAGFALVADGSGSDPCILIVPAADLDRDDLNTLDRDCYVDIDGVFGLGIIPRTDANGNG